MSLAHVAEASIVSDETVNENVGDTTTATRSIPTLIDIPESTTDWISLVRQISMEESDSKLGS